MHSHFAALQRHPAPVHGENAEKNSSSLKLQHMRARVFRIFKDNKHTIPYTIVSPAKYHDDVESVSNGKLITPMMEIRLHKDNNTLCEEALCVWASPAVVKKYTGFDIFNQEYKYAFEGKVLDIEFEWVEGVYPYGELYDSSESLVINVEHSPIKWFEWRNTNDRLPIRRDYVLSDKVRYPKIKMIKDVFWEDFLD